LWRFSDGFCASQIAATEVESQLPCSLRLIMIRPSRKSRFDVLRGGVVKARSAAECGGGAERRGLDDAQHSAMLEL
jgi:hypothetical protein